MSMKGFFSVAKNREDGSGVCVCMFRREKKRVGCLALRELTSLRTGGFPGAQAELTRLA